MKEIGRDILSIIEEIVWGVKIDIMIERGRGKDGEIYRDRKYWYFEVVWDFNILI